MSKKSDPAVLCYWQPNPIGIILPVDTALQQLKRASDSADFTGAGLSRPLCATEAYPESVASPGWCRWCGPHQVMHRGGVMCSGEPWGLPKMKFTKMHATAPMPYVI